LVYINDGLEGKEGTAGPSWLELLLAENHAIRFMFGISTNGAVPSLTKASTRVWACSLIACLEQRPGWLTTLLGRLKMTSYATEPRRFWLGRIADKGREWLTSHQRVSDLQMSVSEGRLASACLATVTNVMVQTRFLRRISE
jgi:hypothetical protein